MERVSIAESVAASVCWLARFRHGEIAAVANGVSYWHKRACRFCETPMDELIALADLSRIPAEELKAWERLPAKARAARVYEAQEDPWWTK